MNIAEGFLKKLLETSINKIIYQPFTFNHEAYVNAACKYIWMTCILRNTTFMKPVVEYNLNKLSDLDLHQHVGNDYYDLKLEIVRAFTERRKAYEIKRELHQEQKTADKKFYQFVQATGYTIDVDPIKLPIRRLIKIYSVYFQDLEKMKRDLDKKGQSPYI